MTEDDLRNEEVDLAEEEPDEVCRHFIAPAVYRESRFKANTDALGSRIGMTTILSR